MAGDLATSLETLELIARMRQARKFPKLTPAPMSAAQLEHAFDVVARAVLDGLSLRSGAALAGVPHRVLAFWIRSADNGKPPYEAWLSGLLKAAADDRRSMLAGLRELALVDTASARELARQTGAPTMIEKELELLRRSKASSADVFYAAVDSVHEFTETLALGATDAKPVAGPVVPNGCADAAVKPEPPGAP